MRFDNLKEKLAEREPIKYNERGYFDFGADNKIKYASTYVPKKIKKGQRNSVISSFTHNLIALNLNFSKEELLERVKDVNKGHCKPPLEDDEILSMFDKKYRNRNKLTLIEPKEKRIVFDPRREWETQEKQSIAAKIINQEKKEETINTIRNAIKDWMTCKEPPKLTLKHLVSKIGLCKNTISKYWNPIKQELGILR